MSDESEPPPSAATIIAMYSALGAAASYIFGHTPGSIPDNIIAELCPSIIVICIFFLFYEVYDVMSCGVMKHKHGLYAGKKYEDIPPKMNEEVYLATRAQANQVEQMMPFVVSALCFSVLVNGKVGATLALVWVILRVMYASTYRNSAGIPSNKKGLGTYTIPCYFIIGILSMGSAIHALRWMMI